MFMLIFCCWVLRIICSVVCLVLLYKKTLLAVVIIIRNVVICIKLSEFFYWLHWKYGGLFQPLCMSSFFNLGSYEYDISLLVEPWTSFYFPFLGHNNYCRKCFHLRMLSTQLYYYSLFTSRVLQVSQWSCLTFIWKPILSRSSIEM